MRSLRRGLASITCGLLALALALAACGPPAPGPLDPAAALSPAALAKLPADAQAALAAGGEQRLLIVIDDGAATAADADDAAAAAPTWRAAKAAVADLALGEGVAIDDDWDALPVVPVSAPSLVELAPLLEDPRVIAADVVRYYRTFDVESFALVRQPAVAAGGRTGAGATVAVLDTGVDYTRAPFGCTAPGVPAGCKVAAARDFAVEDGARDASGHGTNVAGIVIGMAPGARVLALDVFDGGTASSATLLAAYDWVLQNRAAYNVAAINLSLGGGRATAPCTGDPLAAAFQAGRNAGVITAVAAGNDGYLDAISWPACAPAAVSVGAVYDAAVGGLTYSRCADAVTAADRVTCFSNAASFVSVLAPGALIDAAGYRMAGTSQAAPHVAGAAAVLRAALPGESANALVDRLVRGGKSVVDVRTGRAARRLDLVGALALGGDATPPVGTMRIDGGAVYARSRTVRLDLAATDASGVADVCIGEPCTAFVPYAPSVTATLGAGADGSRTATVRFRDRVGNLGPIVADGIVLDSTAPVVSATATTADARVVLRWSATDATAGVGSYRLVTARGATVPPASCTVGSTLVSGAVTSYTHGPLAPGAVWSYRVCATDLAGNTAAGVPFTITVR